MKKKFEIAGMCIAWFAVIVQFILMIQNRQADVVETVIRFFSFFTILTNILVALYFLQKTFPLKGIFYRLFSSKGALTAITSFILIVGLVYQFILRSTWHPTGLQMIVDELLHTLIPLFMLIYFLFTVQKEDLPLKPIFKWLWYPAAYLVIISIRGYFSDYYPYLFLNSKQVGYWQVCINILIIIAFNFILIIGLRFAGRSIVNQKIKKL